VQPIPTFWALGPLFAEACSGQGCDGSALKAWEPPTVRLEIFPCTLRFTFLLDASNPGWRLCGFLGLVCKPPHNLHLHRQLPAVPTFLSLCHYHLPSHIPIYCQQPLTGSLSICPSILPLIASVARFVCRACVKHQSQPISGALHQPGHQTARQTDTIARVQQHFNAFLGISDQATINPLKLFFKILVSRPSSTNS
jgi:hypothetical protein